MSNAKGFNGDFYACTFIVFISVSSVFLSVFLGLPLTCLFDCDYTFYYYFIFDVTLYISHCYCSGLYLIVTVAIYISLLL
jgi:TctA family transporter